ncbi:MAG TPA: acylphosphatase [Candidatus Kapabacteria bacterium]|jgi:acylphosphatase|nr:acylphosphatase [Candidatus Kapabacteria bacterium]HOV91708.1 acylphosphatase [Candidatus Kapabacteria bacterium]
MEDLAKAEFIITGYVQGVGFRYFVYQNAKRLNLRGYVENLMNGNVQVVVEGSRDAIEQMHKILQQGPSRSYVQSVEFTYLDYNHDFDGFEIR